jgi:hypothetical protein
MGQTVHGAAGSANAGQLLTLLSHRRRAPVVQGIVQALAKASEKTHAARELGAHDLLVQRLCLLQGIKGGLCAEFFVSFFLIFCQFSL